MTASYINTSLGSTKPFISGGLATEAAIDDLTHNFIGGLADILDELVDEASMELRSAALQDPQWSQFSPFLEVDLQDGELSYGHTGNGAVDTAITNLEYGDTASTPNPLIRSFAQSNRQDFADSVSKRIDEELDFG